MYPMQFAARDRLTTILSDHLWEGLQKSHAWTNEPQHLLTQSICLFWPAIVNTDFVIDLVVSDVCASAVEAARQSDNTLRASLGDFFMDGMMTSNYIKNGGKLTDAVITRDFGNTDKIVRIVLAHPKGWEVSQIFPTDHM